MKKKLFILPIIIALLSGCSFSFKPFIPSSSVESVDDSSLSKPSEQESSLSISEVDVLDEGYIDYSLNTSKLTNRQLPIGDFGDYVEFIDTSKNDKPEAELVALEKEVKGEKNDIYQTNYQQGLLDFFDYEKKIEMTINISDSEIKKLDNDHKMENRESYRICDLDIYMDGLHFHYLQVGIRQKGNLSRGDILDGEKVNLRHYKLSFEETFDDEFRGDVAKWGRNASYTFRKDRTFFGLSKINIRWNRNLDATYSRELYASELFRSSGVLAARINPIHLTMKVGNKTFEHGVYFAIEQISKSFIKRNLIKGARGGDLYKLTWGFSSSGASFEKSTISHIGVATQYRDGDKFKQNKKAYELKTNKDTSTNSLLISFINNLPNVAGKDSYTFMSGVSHIESFYSYLAASFIMGDPDDLRGNANNSYLYFTGDTGKMIIIPTDFDRALGAANNGGNPTGNHGARIGLYDSQVGYSNSSILFQKTLVSKNATESRSHYLEKIQAIVNNGWLSTSKYETYYNKVREHYGDLITPSNGVNGAFVSFNMDEGTDLGGDSNLRISKYFEEKLNVINKAK